MNDLWLILYFKDKETCQGFKKGWGWVTEPVNQKSQLLAGAISGREKRQCPWGWCIHTDKNHKYLLLCTEWMKNLRVIGMLREAPQLRDGHRVMELRLFFPSTLKSRMCPSVSRLHTNRGMDWIPSSLKHQNSPTLSTVPQSTYTLGLCVRTHSRCWDQPHRHWPSGHQCGYTCLSNDEFLKIV